MIESIQSVFDFLSQKYKSELNQNISVFEQLPETQFSAPVWIPQDNSLAGIQRKSILSGAMLADPEVGICYFFQTYSPSVDAKGQVVRALKLRTALLPRSATPGTVVDRHGSWRVVIHWLVERSDTASWIGQVADVRQDTAHFEEIAVDAIINQFGDWNRALLEHGLPRLLFTTRKVLRMRENEVENWLAADNIISQRLLELPSRVSSDGSKICAEKVLQQLPSILTSRSANDRPRKPDELNKFRIENFRNISDLRAQVHTSNRFACTAIFQGPNGSGKSSIFEALSLGLTGVSDRYARYTADPYNKPTARTQGYLTNYLAPIGIAGELPRISINDAPLKLLSLSEPESIREIISKNDGTIYSDGANSILNEGADALGSRIAAGFSNVADKLLSFVDDNLQQANSRRIDFNRNWSIGTNITRVETARERIASQITSKNLPSIPTINDWLKSVATFSFEGLIGVHSLGDRWRIFMNEQASLPNVLARLQNRDAIFVELNNYFKKYDELRKRTESELGSIRKRVSDWGMDLEQAIERSIDAVRKVSSSPSKLDNEELAELKKNEATLRDELQKIVSAGRLTADRLVHLRGVLDGFGGSWAIENPNSCPTCQTDLAARGGFLAVVNNLIGVTQTQRDDLAKDYKTIEFRLREIQSKLTSSGFSISEVASSELNAIDSALFWLTGSDAKTALVQDGQQILSLCKLLRIMPSSMGIAVDGEFRSAEIADQLWNAFADFDLVAADPVIWNEVNIALLRLLTEVVQEHLPDTYQRLWWELSKNMLPAPWQYPGSIRFAVETRKGQTEARIVLSNPTQEDGNRNSVAAHILNGSESQNLALAWFFVRYLTWGRFGHAYFLIDDPAAQMDQPTFRDFGRLLETVVRLHEWHEIRLSLVLFLHQDDRALDLARATSGTLNLLRWNKNTPIILERLQMFAEEIMPRFPTAKVEQETSPSLLIN